MGFRAQGLGSSARPKTQGQNLRRRRDGFLEMWITVTRKYPSRGFRAQGSLVSGFGFRASGQGLRLTAKSLGVRV